MYIKQLSVFVENKKGKIAEILSVLGENNIDICALSLSDTTDYGILRMIVDDCGRAFDVLSKHGEIVKLSDVIAIAVDNTPGGLAKALIALREEDIAIEYMYAFVGNSSLGAMVVLRTDEKSDALSALKRHRVCILKDSDLHK